MTRSSKRFQGPPPKCPKTLDHPPPGLTKEQLDVPTSELYSVALEEYWSNRGRHGVANGNGEATESTRNGQQSRQMNGTEEGKEEEDPVEEYEPDPTNPSRPTPRHYGLYAQERSTLDWSYHVVPTKTRQSLQDEIVSLVLGTRVKECRDAGDDEPCRISGTGQAELGCGLGDCSGEAESEEGKPLALFTAG